MHSWVAGVEGVIGTMAGTEEVALPDVPALGDGVLRRSLERVLGTDARYLRIRDDAKSPRSSYLPGKRNRLVHVPRRGNYGVIPVGSLLVLDFDHHRQGATPIPDQLDFFTELLGVDLRQSLGVATQSGGLHVYLRYPVPVEEMDPETLPKASLRTYSEAFSQLTGREVTLDADIRSGLVNGYAIGPGSSIPQDGRPTSSYTLAQGGHGFTQDVHSLTIITMPREGLERLQAAVELRGVLEREAEAALGHRRTVRALEEAPEGFASALDSAKSHAKPGPDVLFELRKALGERGPGRFHAKRAFVKSALHCCHDPHAIAIACIELGIDKDSYTGMSIGFRALMADLGRFHPRSSYHSIYCHVGRSGKRRAPEPRSPEDFDLEQHLERVKVKLEKGLARSDRETRLVNPRVLDVPAIWVAMAGPRDRSRSTQQLDDAMAIVDHYLQPLCNVGALRILLARNPMSRDLSLGISRVTQAMRLLRQAGVLLLEQRQRTGLAPTYSVAEDFTHPHLTRVLRRTWALSPILGGPPVHHPLHFDRASGQFRQVFTGLALEPGMDLGDSWDSWLRGLPPFLNVHPTGAGAAVQYLREEREMLGLLLEEGSGEGRALVDGSTGEVIPVDGPANCA